MQVTRPMQESQIRFGVLSPTGSTRIVMFAWLPRREPAGVAGSPLQTHVKSGT